MTLVSKIRDRALSFGFDAIGFADPEDVGQAGRKLSEFIALGRHGEMKWMTKKLDRRKDPKKLWPAVRGVIVVAANYGPETDPLDDLSRRSIGTISVYARNRDYHKILKGRLKQLGNWMSISLITSVTPFTPVAAASASSLCFREGT